MAADVVFTADSPWYTNSYSWNGITEYALRDLDEPARGEYQGYVDVLVVDFLLLPDVKAAEVAAGFPGSSAECSPRVRSAQVRQTARTRENGSASCTPRQVRDRRRPGLK